MRESDFLTFCMRHDDPDPRLATVRAFVDWMIERGDNGDWRQTFLFKRYERVCDGSGVPCMPWKFFGGALEAHGCHRRQDDLIERGKRIRPMIVRIPKAVKQKSSNNVVVPWPEMPARATA